MHKVFHKPTQMFMAIKKIQVQEDDTGLRQIMVELDVLRQSKSRYIVDFYGAFFCDAMVYFCMELIDGGSLDRLIPLGPFPTCVVGRIGCDVLEGLIYMKSAMGVIHRDIRPSNILVDRRGRIKVMRIVAVCDLLAIPEHLVVRFWSQRQACKLARVHLRRHAEVHVPREDRRWTALRGAVGRVVPRYLADGDGYVELPVPRVGRAGELSFQAHAAHHQDGPAAHQGPATKWR